MNWKFVLILPCMAVCFPLSAARDGGLLEAAEIHIGSETSATAGRLEIRAIGDRRQLLFIPEPTRCNPE